MDEKPHQSNSPGEPARLTERVSRQEARKLKARREHHKALWLGFGVSGLIGWGIAIPSLLGLAAGIWIDSRCPGMRCWTLTLFGLGIFVGCINAWYWIGRELDAIRRDHAESSETDSKEDKKHD